MPKKTLSIFPDARTANADGIVAVGGDFSVSILQEAYSKGIFPWPQEGLPLLWFSPDPRGVIDFSEFHVPKSLIKWAAKNSKLKITLNQAFKEVVKECRLQQRPQQSGTWILEEMEQAYFELQKKGLAISLECWDDEKLVGGIYGVLLDHVFSGESMFYKKPNCSKYCLWKLVEYLKSIGHTWMDIQMVTPVTALFGGKYISREEFLIRKGL
jgi:leucyl/phenylalanyl-tRNA--protein transferase